MRMPSSLGRQWFLCDLRDSIAREVCFTGMYEPQETAIVRAVLKPGMTFIDVGANWGYFTLLAGHLVGAHGRILSLEPDPRLFRKLEANVAMNRLEQVRAFQLAAADTAGSLTLAGFDEAQGNFGLSRILEKEDVHLFTDARCTSPCMANGLRPRSQKDECPLFRVLARTLDGLLAEAGLGNIDLIKMDIEGAEGMALNGMRETLKSRRIRHLLLELHPAPLAERGHSTTDIIQQLRGYGYVGWRIDHSAQQNRRSAYRRTACLRDILRPLDSNHGLDQWPHLLWVLPETELAW
jgi:FkbM family methyltransferase